MTEAAVRLQATVENPGVVTFAAQFSAPDEDEASRASAGELVTGDGASYALGEISPPTAVTWREQRSLPLVTHTYAGSGPFTAEFRLDGLAAASEVVQPALAVPRTVAGEAQEEGPALFALMPVANEPFQRVLKLHMRGLQPGQRLRVDGGAGQVRDLAGEEGQEVLAEMLLSYLKPGLYLVSVELLDGEGFWIETLAHTPLEIAAPEDQAPAEPAGAARELGVAAAPAEALGVPWLPYRNFKARPGGTRTYSQPGGGAVRRSVGAGVWLSARQQTVAGGNTWYQTAGGDWVRGDTVTFVQPSDLRGVLLDSTTPPPPPPPPPPNRTGVVTATRLNVRARPGVAANNPPVGVLQAGAQVTIFEEQMAGGEVWYRIGVNRWVAASWVRVTAPRSATDASQGTATVKLPFGRVVPDVLNVRAQPGVAANNPVIAQLKHYDIRPILKETTVSGSRWYQVGEQQWVEARQMGVARLRSRPSSIGKDALWVAVNLSQQTVVCYEGDRPVFAALGASGLPGTPTVQGIFRTWRRLDTGKMSGPGYYIEDVTWTCYFYSGYALHTAYWHDKFGAPRSHGCVNLSPYDAWWIYQWSARGGPNSPIVYVYSA
ncbi:MAG: L,D-transpeptidase family protein [Nitrososphaerales archaeon]